MSFFSSFISSAACRAASGAASRRTAQLSTVLALAGRYPYEAGEYPDDIFRRHDNCTCTVTYECGRQRQNVWTKRTWEVPDKDAGAKKPVVLSKEQAGKLQNKALSGLTMPAKGGIIDATGFIEENYSRKVEIASIKEDLEAVNPKRLTDNCQRCVPTYVLRRRGYNVEALPTGENKQMDILLSQNPHIVWEKAGSTVVPKSTRGSKYFGKPEIEKYMKALPDGAMCEIRCAWNDREDGHVFVAEKIEGKIHYIDPQIGDDDVSRYFKSMKKDKTTFWRIDDAAVNDDIIKYCCKSK